MAVTCDVIVSWNASPEQLAVLGSSLWRWCNRVAGDTGIYQYLDNQALADLIAGKLPVSRQPSQYTERRGVHLRVRDEVSPDRQTAVDGLREELQAGGIEDVVVDGTSWNVVELEGRPRPTCGSAHEQTSGDCVPPMIQSGGGEGHDHLARLPGG